MRRRTRPHSQSQRFLYVSGLRAQRRENLSCCLVPSTQPTFGTPRRRRQYAPCSPAHPVKFQGPNSPARPLRPSAHSTPNPPAPPLLPYSIPASRSPAPAQQKDASSPPAAPPHVNPTASHEPHFPTPTPARLEQAKILTRQAIGRDKNWCSNRAGQISPPNGSTNPNLQLAASAQSESHVAVVRQTRITGLAVLIPLQQLAKQPSSLELHSLHRPFRRNQEARCHR